MKTTIKQWGNSLGIRIPKPLAEELNLSEDSPIDLSIVGRAVVITPADNPDAQLDVLLADINQQNTHEEIDWGKPMGQESR